MASDNVVPCCWAPVYSSEAPRSEKPAPQAPKRPRRVRRTTSKQRIYVKTIAATMAALSDVVAYSPALTRWGLQA